MDIISDFSKFKIETLIKFSNISNLLEIIDEALNSYTDNVTLWKFKLNMSMDSEKKNEEINNMFKKALESVKEKVI